MSMMNGGSDIVRLDGIGMYINIINGDIFFCTINTAGYPEIDRDGGMEFEPMNSPRSQTVLDIINVTFKTEYKMEQFYKGITT